MTSFEHATSLGVARDRMVFPHVRRGRERPLVDLGSSATRRLTRHARHLDDVERVRRRRATTSARSISTAASPPSSRAPVTCSGSTPSTPVACPRSPADSRSAVDRATTTSRTRSRRWSNALRADTVPGGPRHGARLVLHQALVGRVLGDTAGGWLPMVPAARRRRSTGRVVPVNNETAPRPSRATPSRTRRRRAGTPHHRRAHPGRRSDVVSQHRRGVDGGSPRVPN